MIYFLRFSLIVSLLFSALFAFANGGHYTAGSEKTESSKAVQKKKAPSYRTVKKSWEQQLGRKLQFSERMGLRLLLLVGEPEPGVKKRANSNALLGFIFGILGIVGPGLFAIPGLILSNNALRQEKNNPGILEGERYGFAQAGKILSIVGLVLLGLIILLIIALSALSASGF